MPGVALGPLAVLGASRFVETYDVELGFGEVGGQGAHVVAACVEQCAAPQVGLAQVGTAQVGRVH